MATSAGSGVIVALADCGVLGLVLIFAAVRRPGRAQDYEVDLALVLAIDCSFSVDSARIRAADGGPWPRLHAGGGEGAPSRQGVSASASQ